MTDSERKALQNKITGPVVPLNIPFKQDESIDYNALEKYVDFLASKKVPTIILTNGSSEYASLCDDEIYEITKVVAVANAGRSIFVGATKSWSIKRSIEYIEFAKECGAQSVKIQPPFFGNGGKIDQDNLLDYYKRINQLTILPLWAYTMPVANRHPGIKASTWKYIVEDCTNVYAMKTDAEMMFGYYDLIQAAGKKAMIVSGGQMKTMIYGWPLGSRAYLCPIAFFMPEISLRFTNCMKNGSLDEAIHIIHTFEDRIIGMCTKIDWLALSKGMLYTSGLFPTPRTRCPAYTANKAQLKEIQELHDELQQLAEEYYYKI